MEIYFSSAPLPFDPSDVAGAYLLCWGTTLIYIIYIRHKLFILADFQTSTANWQACQDGRKSGRKPTSSINFQDKTGFDRFFFFLRDPLQPGCKWSANWYHSADLGLETTVNSEGANIGSLGTYSTIWMC